MSVSVCLLVGQSVCLSVWISIGLFVVMHILFVWHDLSVQICVIPVSGKRNTSVEFALTPMYLIILVFTVCYRTDCS